VTVRYSAVVLAGGGGRRLGGVDKPALPVGGRSMLSRVLDAVAGAYPRVVVGPPRADLPADVVQVREDPPGGGPVAAIAAGLDVSLVREDSPGGGPVAGLDVGLGAGPPPLVAVLAADLPFLTAGAVAAMLAAAGDGDLDGAVLVDAGGREQWLCGVWRTAALRVRLAELDPPAGRAMRQLVSGLRVTGVTMPPGAGGRLADNPPAWYDCDTEDDYRQAEEWA
jgi:molybdopterin-guanine dinucleotide biosynthesis protein A